MTLAGLGHWGYDQNHPKVFQFLEENLPDGPEIAHSPVFVVEEDSDVVGFYGLRDRGDHVEVLRMFPRVDRIGRGYGWLMWDHAVMRRPHVEIDC